MKETDRKGEQVKMLCEWAIQTNLWIFIPCSVYKWRILQ